MEGLGAQGLGSGNAKGAEMLREILRVREAVTGPEGALIEDVWLALVWREFHVPDVLVGEEDGEALEGKDG